MDSRNFKMIYKPNFEQIKKSLVISKETEEIKSPYQHYKLPLDDELDSEINYQE